MKSDRQILKFGGTSVGSGERIRRVAQIIATTCNNPEEAFPVVVVSAMAKVTDQLLRIARHAHAGNSVEEKYELKALKQKHREAAENAVHNIEARNVLLQNLEDAFTALERDSAALRSVGAQFIASNAVGRNELRPYVDAVAAWGERLSVLLVAAAVTDIGVRATPIRQEVIITSYPPERPASVGLPLAGSLPEGQVTPGPGTAFGVVVGADPLPEETRAHARALVHPLIEQQIVPVAAGFIGHTTDGVVTTLGRNGSDYSATAIGAALDCVEISIYTDVDGVLTADPRLVRNARLLPQLSYAEAARLSWFGAKVLHPRTLIPIAHRNIPVRVRNTFRPHLRGTAVGPEDTQRSGASAITVRRHLTLVTVESTDLFGAPENAGQVFALAARAGAAPIAICSSSGHHLSFVVEEQAAASVVALLQHDMEGWSVRCRSGLAACACIGSGFTADPMSPARAITALARERVPVITQGATEQGITLIVEDQDSECALRCLHRDLIAPVIPLVRHAPIDQEKRREMR